MLVPSFDAWRLLGCYDTFAAHDPLTSDRIELKLILPSETDKQGSIN